MYVSSHPVSAPECEWIPEAAHQIVVSGSPEGRATTYLGVKVVAPSKIPATTLGAWGLASGKDLA